MTTSRSRIPLLFLTLSSLLAGAAVTPLQAQSEESFAGEARVTAIDLAARVKTSFGISPSKPKMSDFLVLEEGEPQQVVGLAPLGTDEGEEPWRIAVYFDLALASPATVRAAALALSEEVAALTSLGTVEVVASEDSPRLLLAATRDSERVDFALGTVFGEYRGQDEIAELRRLGLAGEWPSEVSAADAARAEHELVRSRLDALLTWVSRDQGRGAKVLFYVADGFDLAPGEFYRRRLAGQGIPPRPLDDAAETLARGLAAYGWVVFPLRFDRFEEVKDDPTSEFDRSRYEARGEDAFVISRGVKLGRKPAGRSDAEESEAEVFLAQTAPLDSLAAATGGEVLDKSTALTECLEDLADWVRLTYQVGRGTDGSMRPVEVKARRGGWRVSTPKWVRSATPEAVVEARVRRIVSGELDAGDLTVSAKLGAASDSGDRSLEVKLDLTPSEPVIPFADSAAVRVTVADGGEGRATEFTHMVAERQDLSGTFWAYGAPITAPAEAEWIVVVVEELGGGAWGSWALQP